MEKISVEYQITVSDFRQATYYGLFLRHRTALRSNFRERLGNNFGSRFR